MTAPWLFLSLVFLFGFPAQAQTNNELTTEKYFSIARQDSSALRLFLSRMPKGADLHNHLTGAVYAESIVTWAAEDGWCSDSTFALTPPPCDSSTGRQPLAERIKTTQGFRDAVDAFSVRNFERRPISGHNQFFTTFLRFGAYTPNRLGDMLAEVARRAERQHVQYLELMESARMIEAAMLGARIGWMDDFTAFYAKLQEMGLPALVAAARQDYADAVAKKNKLLGCDRDVKAEGCGITIRWLAQVIRTFPREMVFGQVALAFDLARHDPTIVGLNLVAPEDDQITLQTYTDQMRMIGALHRLYPDVNVALHAGELVLGQVPPEDLRFHIRQAIEVAGAKRIGHGIAIAYESDAEQLLQQMARNGTPVEINLTSNDTILGIRGAAHPFSLYRKFNVPMVLSTDDEGVSRIDLTHEYARAATTYALTYQDLKQLSRNSLTYSFLPGSSLWADARRSQPITACAKDRLGAGKPTLACAEFLNRSEKAKLQWQLEAKTAAFEAEVR